MEQQATLDLSKRVCTIHQYQLTLNKPNYFTLLSGRTFIPVLHHSSAQQKGKALHHCVSV